MGEWIDSLPKPLSAIVTILAWIVLTPLAMIALCMLIILAMRVLNAIF